MLHRNKYFIRNGFCVTLFPTIGNQILQIFYVALDLKLSIRRAI